MKATLGRKKSIWNYFSDFSNASFFSDPWNLHTHQYSKQSTKKFIFIQKLILEEKLKNLYQRLLALYRKSNNEFEQCIQEGKVKKKMHPMDEQSWFIHHLEKYEKYFSVEELWILILNHEQREKYASFFTEDEDLGTIELFFQNYLLQSLSGDLLKDLFLKAFQDINEREDNLKILFECLHCHQGKALLKALKKERIPYSIWILYCQSGLNAMRNSQLLMIISVIPSEIEHLALEKLYPCEILEVIHSEKDEKKKGHLIDKVLKDYKSWWSSFPQDEIKETYNQILALKS
ncbi:MAG: hypothetical protein S4CHLAM7_09420 [Chlamydiae bacterium]|nr:hypothetical protein [Chlamydiota bacterium]